MDTCIQDSLPSALISNDNVKLEANRRSANFHPSVWGDFFLSFSSNNTESDSCDEAELQYLKEKVKSMLNKTLDESAEKLYLIDIIQRLGVAYHFESEIQACLRNIYNSYYEFLDEDRIAADNLRFVALRFRLLRQQGYRISSDVFTKFKYQYDEGKFSNSSTGSNLEGILSLYEAANYGVHGEDILDEALAFTSSYLESLLPTLNHLDAAKVGHALNLPVQKALNKVAARLYIPIYEDDESHNAILLKFAKLEFNLLQKLLQKELCDLTKWWKGLNCPKNFPFARDRLVETYFWISGEFFEPKYCIARKFQTKVMAMSSIIDDIFDVYGSLDELILFTDAIERWDISAAEELPSYMRHCYQALLDVYEEIEELGIQGKARILGVSYAKAAMQQLERAYLEEARWFHNGDVPSVEEYLKVALVTCGYLMLTINSFVGMGEIVTKEAFDWISNQPLLVRAASMICRLTDDIVGHEFEQRRGHVSSAVECYMKQNGASKQEAYAEFQRMVKNAWKDINDECLEPIAAPMPLLERVVNMARVIHLLYKDEDNYTHSKTKLKHLITLLLVDPMKI